MRIVGTNYEKAEHFSEIGFYEQAMFFILKDISDKLDRIINDRLDAASSQR